MARGRKDDEGSAADMRQDRAQMKRRGQTLAEVERSAEDRRADRARQAKAAKRK